MAGFLHGGFCTNLDLKVKLLFYNVKLVNFCVIVSLTNTLCQPFIQSQNATDELKYSTLGPDISLYLVPII